jgi:ribonuclease R
VTNPSPGEFQAIARHQRPARCPANPFHVVALDAAGDLHTHQQRAFGLALRPTPTSPVRSAATRICWCIGSSRRFWPKRGTSCQHCQPPVKPMPSWPGDWKKALASGSEPKSAQANQCRGDGLAGRRLHCSANERRADEASRDVEAWLKCKYMREHLGEEYGGVVTSATSFGLFVTWTGCHVCRRIGDSHHRTGR